MENQTEEFQEETIQEEILQEEKSIESKLILESQFKSGANWFYWIAGLSLLNSLIFLSGSNWNFVIGLGITQIIDFIGGEIAAEIGSTGKVLAFVIDVFAAGIFGVFGINANKKRSWAFIVGMSLYALDGLIFVVAKDFLGIGFHAFALFGIFKGYKALKFIQETEF